MKKLLNILFSSRLMAVLILVFAISIAIATFIENDFGSQTARATVYYSWWFSLMLFLGMINLSGMILIKKLYKKEKLSIFIFHLAFLLILVGAAVTHYFGFEGYMHIRMGQTSNLIVSSNTYFSAIATQNGHLVKTEKQINFSALSSNYHKIKLNLYETHIDVECLKIVPNAIETIKDDPKGIPMVELVIAVPEGKKTLILSSTHPQKIGNLIFSVNSKTNISGVNISFQNNNWEICSSVPAIVMNMASQNNDSLNAQINYPLQIHALYNFGGILVVIKNSNPSGKSEVFEVKDAKPDELPDALYLKISAEGKSESVLYFASRNTINPPSKIKIKDVLLEIGYGAKTVQLPFSIHLERFILERYPGSNSPSWFESKIILNDENNRLSEEHRIFMNNVLKYNGYRFYQSSYDTDEQGTILSVNHDFWGTLITYLGYLMLAIGIVFSMLNKNSRFRKLSTELSLLKESSRTTILLILFVTTFISGTFTASAQNAISDSVAIDNLHAAKFGELLVQDPGGRIKPINSLSSELLRKISRQSELMGQTSDQVLLGMLTYPEYWQNIPMIKVGNPEIQKILHIKKPYVSFWGVFNHLHRQSSYILNSYVNEAYQKKPAYRTTFDTEIIRFDERVNLCYQIYYGKLLRIFPKQGDPLKTWYPPTDTLYVFSGRDLIFTNNILPIYIKSLQNAKLSNDYKLPEEALDALSLFQINNGKELIPSQFKVKSEILYNRINVFDRLGVIYGLVGFALLILQFLSIFLPKIKLKSLILIFTVIVILCFAAHLTGLAARWYISGHAPWSNAYESLVYIAFATVLAGLLFSRKSIIALSVTSVLAWLILFVAHLNWMDPEITNLVPVLKSFWLLIHVAIITASYGFLALGALIAFLNLILMTTQTKTNFDSLGMIIAELSIIIEMTLILGLYMLTIGTFLGGVWANESWGRYWGWDSKETWALVSVLTYAFVAHMRMVPGLKGNYLFNLLALLSFSSIVMTYFGVNYYLSGLHSYAKGNPMPIPIFVYYTLASIGIIAATAYINQRRLKLISKN